MEDEYIIDTPYYATTYLDDSNTTHLVNIKNKRDLEFLQDRFTVISSIYRKN